MGLFWPFLFRFTDIKIHGISFSNITLIHSENGILTAEVSWELLGLPTESQATRRGRPRWIFRQKFPKRTRILPIPSKPYSVHSAHSTIESRMNKMVFRSFQKRSSSQKNTNTSIPSNPILEFSPQKTRPKQRDGRGQAETTDLFQ